jgi:hypothetical protein
MGAAVVLEELDSKLRRADLLQLGGLLIDVGRLDE